MNAEILKHCLGLPERSFHAGQILVAPDQPSSDVYVLKSGTVEVRSGDVVLATADQPGTIFGEISALLDVTPTATVAAVDPVECWVVDYFDRFKEIPGMAIAIARILAGRLQSVTERIRSSAAAIEEDPAAGIDLADLLSGIETDLTIDWKKIEED